MKTDELIDFLSKNSGAAEPAVPPKRMLGLVLPWVSIAVLACLLLLGFAPPEVFTQPGPWLKLALAAYALLLGAVWLDRASRPGKPEGKVPTLLLVGGLALAALGAWALSSTAPEERLDQLLGHSWYACPWNIAGLSLLILPGLILVVRHLAPVSPAKAGALSGLVAGAIAALVYGLACTETAIPFVALWYPAGIALSSLIGYTVGRFALNW